jgi:uncharacterized membrane protein
MSKATAVVAKLIALSFDDPYKADEARAALHRMEGEGLLELDETAVITKTKSGKKRITQDLNIVAKDQHVGHVVGLVAAAITGTAPFIMAGTLAGRLVGTLRDNGITNRFINELSKELEDGTSMLIILAHSDPERRQKVMERLRVFQPKVHETDLAPELEQELTKALESEGLRM